VVGALLAACRPSVGVKGRDQTVHSHPRIVRIAGWFCFLAVDQTWADVMGSEVHWNWSVDVPRSGYRDKRPGADQMGVGVDPCGPHDQRCSCGL
jgi:hypothetical protein